MPKVKVRWPRNLLRESPIVRKAGPESSGARLGIDYSGKV